MKTSSCFFVGSNDIRNGPLKSGTEYRFLQRGLNNARKVIANGEWTPPVSTRKKVPPDEDGPDPGLIAGVVVVVISVIVIVSVALVYFRRRRNNNNYKRNDNEGKYINIFVLL